MHASSFLLAALPTSIDPRSATAPSGEAIERKLNQKRPEPEERPERRIITSIYLEPAEQDLLATLPDEALHAVALPPFVHCEVPALPLFTGGELARRDPALVLNEAQRRLALAPW